METKTNKCNIETKEDEYSDWSPLTQEEHDRIFGHQTEIDFFPSSC